MIVLIDGFSVAFRAFYALPDTLMTSDGTPTNVIHGFLSMINKVIKDYKPDQLIITWDLPGKTFRNEIYEEYKANRTPAPDNFNIQIPLLHDLIDSFNIPQVSKREHEADDVLGSLSKLFNEIKKDVLIVTGDRDIFQLISKKTKILYTKKGISDTDTMDEKSFKEKYEITPAQYIEYLALKGDPSDNIPGLPGVGEKTAITLLKKYKNLDNILQNLDELTPKLKNTFKTNKDILFISKKLATIKTDLELDLPDLKLSDSAYFSDDVLENAQEKVKNLELNKYTLKNKNEIDKEKDNPEDKNIDEYESIEGEIFILSFDNETYFFNNNKFGKYTGNLSKINNYVLITSQSTISLTDDKLDFDKFEAYDCMLFLKDPSIKPDNLLNIAKHIDRSSGLSKKSDVIDFLKFFQKKTSIINNEISEFRKDKKLSLLYKDLDFPMLQILSSMNKKGVKVSLKKIDKLSDEINIDLNIYKKNIKSITKKDFNLNSPKQLSEILYEDMKYPIIKKTPKGAPSTDASVLEELSKSHELPKLILKYREYEKLRSTYIEGLKTVIVNNRVHTSYNLFGTTTGRLSSEKPNLQNIPNKTEMGQKIREFFVADSKHTFVIADYSQIELRVLAHLSDDKNMINMLKNRDADIHSETAAKIFNTNIDSVTKDMRRKAKEVNFGLIYGMESFGLSKSLDISKKEADELINAYFGQFPKIKGFLEKIVVDATKNTYTETLYGRKRFIRELSSSNFQVKAMGKRIAMNAPIQGTASDIMKIAMIKLIQKLSSLESTNLLLQIHDEIIIQTPKILSDKVSNIVQKEMEDASSLKVPLFVDIKENSNLSNLN